MFAGKYFCGSLEKSQKLEPAKISCHGIFSVPFLNWIGILEIKLQGDSPTFDKVNG